MRPCPLSSRTPIRCLPPAVLPLARQEGSFFRISPSRSACGAGERAVLLPVLALYRRAFDLPGKKLPSCQSVTGLVVSFVAVRRWRHIFRWFTCCRCPVGGTGRSMYPARRNFFRCRGPGQWLEAWRSRSRLPASGGKKGPQAERPSDAERRKKFFCRRRFPDKAGGHAASVSAGRRAGREKGTEKGWNGEGGRGKILRLSGCGCVLPLGLGAVSKKFIAAKSNRPLT